jgi:hypothetical protein
VLADRNSNTNFDIHERARGFSNDSLYTNHLNLISDLPHLTPPDIVTMSTDNPARVSGDMTGAEDASDDPQLLDPVTSQRRYWRDPLTGIQREIWRPGIAFRIAISFALANI